MTVTISVADRRWDLSAVLDRVHRQAETYLIEQDGEAVAAIRPIEDEEPVTWQPLTNRLHAVALDDSSFADTLEEIQRDQPA